MTPIVLPRRDAALLAETLEFLFDQLHYYTRPPNQHQHRRTYDFDHFMDNYDRLLHLLRPEISP
jgi:hypothetical protein